MLRFTTLIVITIPWVAAQPPDPAYLPLQKAYSAQQAHSYEQALASFQQAIAISPARASIRKDFAYLLLKVGENEAARDQFEAAMKIDPSDNHVALEYAFLCNETKRQAVARRIFDRIRKTGDPVAEQAFQNIDQPLADGIARWLKALELSPDNFSAHQELATLAEQRDELPLAAEHYEKAFKLRPDERELLLHLGRVSQALGRVEQAQAALLAASRGPQARSAELARELLPQRYPYVYEFERALALDPTNLDLRRELAYLDLQMNQGAAAEREFTKILEIAPNDLLSSAQLGFLRFNRKDFAGAQPLFDTVLKGGDAELADRVRVALKMPPTLTPRVDDPGKHASIEAKTLAEKSLKAGFMKDALKYLQVAHESDPLDFWVMLKLGWTYNMLHQDAQAIQWFKLARMSPDPATADEAAKAYNNLRPSQARFRTTAWAFPFFSSRWHDAFGYGQVKTELRLGDLPFRPYLSMRFVGDVKGQVGSTFGSASPQYLSETSVIFAAGVSTKPWNGITGWFEAGEAVKYLSDRKDVGSMIPDYRGGLAYAKGFGHLLNGGKGWFVETNDDGVFVSRFGKDLLLYSQNRSGYTLAPFESQGGFQPQLYWNYNGTIDRSGQYWANFVETGPGLKFKLQSLPQSMVFSVNFVRGIYTVNEGNPRRPNYFDLRVGFWYAFVR